LEASLVPGLGREAVEKMSKHKPKTIGDMKRLPGLTPADVMNVFIYISTGTVPRGTSRGKTLLEDE